jgi:distribution and morphology protein 31
LQSSHDTGVLSWVTSGRCDLVADIRFPREEEVDLSTIVADIVEKFDKEVGGNFIGRHTQEGWIPGQRVLSRGALEVPKEWNDAAEETYREQLRVEKKREKDERLERLKASGKADELEYLDDVEEVEEKTVAIDFDIRFKELKATVPVRSDSF